MKVLTHPFSSREGGGGVNRVIRDIIKYSKNEFVFNIGEIYDVSHSWGLGAVSNADLHSCVGLYFEEDVDSYGDALEPMSWQTMRTWNEIVFDNCKKAKKVHTDGLFLKNILNDKGIDSVHISNAIDTDFWKPITDEKSEIYYKNKIVFFGSGRRVKKPYIILEIAEQMPDMEFIMLGLGTEKGTLKIKYGNVPDNVICMGDIHPEEAREIVSSSFCSIFPAVNDASSAALREAMSCGCIPICSDCVPHREVVRHGIGGWLVAENESTSYVDAIKSILDMNTEEEELMRANARERIVESFNIVDYVEKMDKIYGELYLDKL